MATEYRVTTATAPRPAGWPKGAHKESERHIAYFLSAQDASAYFRHCASVKRDNQALSMERTATPEEQRRPFRVEDAYGSVVYGDPVWWIPVAASPFGPVEAKKLWVVEDGDHFYTAQGILHSEAVRLASRDITEQLEDDQDEYEWSCRHDSHG